MTSTERKRRWRLANPERSRESERRRAAARRSGWWSRENGVECRSSDSYWRYEYTWARHMQRLCWPMLGAGAHRLPTEEFSRRVKAWGDKRRAEALEGLTPWGRALLEEFIAKRATRERDERDAAVEIQIQQIREALESMR